MSDINSGLDETTLLAQFQPGLRLYFHQSNKSESNFLLIVFGKYIKIILMVTFKKYHDHHQFCS